MRMNINGEILLLFFCKIKKKLFKRRFRLEFLCYYNILRDMYGIIILRIDKLK